MKFRYIKLLVLGTGILFASCDSDFLDTPPEHVIEASDFFKNETQLKSYINGLYDQLSGSDVYTDDAASDNVLPLIVNDRVKGTRVVPVEIGSGGWSWSALRDINYFLDNYENADDEEAILKYGGIAKFFRAYFYYNKLKKFGNVPIYDHVLTAGSEELYKARDSREDVVKFILSDIDNAIENIPADVELNEITKYTALILKARICLFEGTFRKYHGIGEFQDLLNQAADAANQLIESGVYTLYTNGDSKSSYRELFDIPNQNSTETILARDYDPNFLSHNLGYLATSATSGAYGIPKDLINSYLMIDGARFTDNPDYATLEFNEEMQNRDPRLVQTTAGPDFTAYQEEEPEFVNLSGTTTGYRVIKAISSKDQWGNKTSTNDIILFRYAEALLIYAEAKAELGTITQADIDKSINQLRDRVGMPHLSLSDANGTPDVYLENMYPNVDSGENKGVILEIRRERRIELFLEGLRWDDLMRWKEGKKLEQPMVGIYFSDLGAYDFTGNGSTDVYLHDGDASGAPSGTPTIINVNERGLTEGTSGNLNPFNEVVIFDESKDYFYPIPLEEIALNSNLSQNPGW